MTQSPEPATPAIDPVPKGSQVVFMGDSWTYGYAADPITNGFAYVLGRAMSWDFRLLPDGSSTGFLNPGTRGLGTYAEQLSNQPRDPNVDLLLIQGGLNDIHVEERNSTVFNDAVEVTIAAARKTYPNAQIVVMGPLYPATPTPSIETRSVDSRLTYTLDQLGIPYISPTQEGWISTEQEHRRLISMKEGQHPNTAGHAYIADRLVAAFSGAA